MTGKKCKRCGIIKPLTEDFFHKHKKMKLGFSTNCRICNNKRGREHYQNNKEKYKENNIKRMYGITLKGYKILYNIQDGVCAICGKPEKSIQNGTLFSLSIDHNHKTGKVRGLLCFNCNSILGAIELYKGNPNKWDNYLGGK